MTDQVTVRNLPDGGSCERVAFDLWRALLQHLESAPTGLATIQRKLDLYAECLMATKSIGHDARRIS